MNLPQPALLLRDVGIPALFVLLWSTGFIGARLGLPHAGSLMFLTLRYALAALLLLLVVIATRAPWPRRWAEIGHYGIAGLLVHGVYLGGVFVGISLGVEAGVSALIVGLQPLLTAALASVFLGERVLPRQWIGLGLGLFGVSLVLARKLGLGPDFALIHPALEHPALHHSGLGHPGWGILACGAALLGITVGTLYQKRFCKGMDLRTGGVVQFTTAGLATAPFALIFEDTHIDWSGAFIFALLWLVLVLSLGAVSLLYVLIRRGAAAQVASLFFLVPPCTVLIAWPLFGETPGTVGLIGMVITAAGVALASRAAPRGMERRPGCGRT